MRARSPAAEEEGRCLGSCNGDAARPRRPRRRPALPRHHDHAAGDLVGSGGCSLHTAGTTTVWNLAFVLRPQLWGQGYAQEVAAAGRRCAHMLRPDLPVTAVVAARNPRSQRAVERAGLDQTWRGPDTKDPDPAAQLLLYADRALNEEQVRALTA